MCYDAGVDDYTSPTMKTWPELSLWKPEVQTGGG